MNLQLNVFNLNIKVFTHCWVIPYIPYISYFPCMHNIFHYSGWKKQGLWSMWYIPLKYRISPLSVTTINTTPLIYICTILMVMRQIKFKSHPSLELLSSTFKQNKYNSLREKCSITFLIWGMFSITSLNWGKLYITSLWRPGWGGHCPCFPPL